MFKKILITILSVLMAFTAVFTGVGCGGGNKTFTVTFDGGADDAILVKGELVQTVSSWEQIVEPIFNRDGYNSDGWDRIIRQINSDTKITQLWAEYDFTVIFKGNGGYTEDGQSQVELSVNSAYNLKEAAPTFIKQGYSYVWDTYLEGVVDKCTINAIWTANEYKIHFFDDDGQSLGEDDLIVTYDKAIGELPVLENRVEDGEIYRFVRWETIEKTPIVKGMIWKNLADLNVYAHWTEDEYIINYNLNGGNYTNNPGSYSSGDEIYVNNPTRYGYDFIGWSGTDIDGLTMQLVISNTTGDKTYTANWKAKTFTLFLDAGEGTLVGGDKVSVTYAGAISNITAPVRENYKFIGWKCAGSDTLYNNDVVWDMEPTDLTLVAQYKRIYTLKFSLTTVIRNKERECVLVSSKDVVIKPGQSLEDVSIEILEGETLASLGIINLPDVDPIDEKGIADGKDGDYSFGGYWRYSNEKNGDTKLYKVEPDKPFNDKNFPDIAEDGVVLIIPHCRAHWTPSY